MCNRRGVGIDLNSKYIQAYKLASKEMNFYENVTFHGDALTTLADIRQMSSLLNNEYAKLILIDPPYGNMMSKPKTGADIDIYGAKSTPFTEDTRDLGNMEREEFLISLKTSVELSMRYLKKRGYVVVFIKDLQPKGKQLNLLHFEIINKLNEIENLNYKGLKIWSDQNTKLYPYGYPFAFVANQTHQYILIFRKEK